MKPPSRAIEELTIRRANVADIDKVRYRVYSTPSDFVAVIAESALMAVKVSGIKKPHKIVRDIPTTNIAIEKQKMLAIDADAARVSLPVKQAEREKNIKIDVAGNREENPMKALFKPMNLGDLRRDTTGRARILPPELLNEIIEQHVKTAVASAPAPADMEALHAAPAPVEIPRPPEPSAEERLLDMAQTLPQTASPADEPMAEGEKLSPEEVEKLLNG